MCDLQGGCREQVNDEMWIMQFQNTILICHIVIFLEFGVVHYAARQIARQRLKHKDGAEYLIPSYRTLPESGYNIDTDGGAVRSDYRGEGVTPARSRSQSARSGADGMAEEIHDGVAGRRVSRTAAESNSARNDAHGFSIQEDTVIGMPSVSEMLTETLSRPDDRTCSNRLLPCRRESRAQEEELSEIFGGSLAAEGALRARTWHRYEALC